MTKEILVFPRNCIQDYQSFVPWNEADPVLRCIPEQAAWMPREEAETSTEWVQPIPCALIRNDAQDYCVLKRTRQTRADLRARVSLLVGGHVDRPHQGNIEPFTSLMLLTLRRELEEEVGLVNSPTIQPVGIAIDPASIAVSRHVAFVYETLANHRIAAQAPEEFSSRSKFTGRFFSPLKLSGLHGKFDPWSRILFEEYIAESYLLAKWPRQIRLPLPLNE